MNLKELGDALGLEEDEYRELIELFIETGAVDLAQMQTAVAENDLDRIIRSAHTIKGAAGNLGLTALHETAKQIETAAVQSHTAVMAQAIATLGAQFAQIRNDIQPV
jgi:histidine phosphotransfer protein HptB